MYTMEDRTPPDVDSMRLTGSNEEQHHLPPTEGKSCVASERVCVCFSIILPAARWPEESPINYY